MLRELHISNLAVIADARIELDAGLNCFTGATGAGKSLVIGAVEVLLGLRSPAEMLRPGADEGRVSGVFEIRSPQLLKSLDHLADLPVSADGGEVLLSRRLYASGRTSISLNGSPITLGMLKQIAELLIDVHGQHDHQFLLKPSNQLDVLDQFGKLEPLRAEYHEVWSKLQDAKQRLADLTASRTLRQQQLELYRFQAQEIDAAEINPGEYEELQARASLLGNLEKLKKDAGAAHAALYEADGSILERLKMMGGVLGELSQLDQNLKPTADIVRDATIQLEEAAFDLSRYLDRLDLDPGELAEVIERLNLLNRLLNKYGQTAESTLAYREEIRAKIIDLEQASEDLSHLDEQIAPLSKRLNELGAKLSDQRKATARKLAPLVEKQLAELGMEKAKFTVAFEPEARGERGTGGSPVAGAAGAPSPSPNTPREGRGDARGTGAPPVSSASGFDQIEFVAQTNPGLTPQPLRKIASGGELSRIMLALKSILAASDRVSVLVFDEIDANVGGRLGAVIGEKLRDLARHHQVLCITHLPQIACFADRHLTVRKTTDVKTTASTVRTLEGEERLTEIAEMIGGHQVTETTRKQAREMLQSASACHPAAKQPKKEKARR